MKTIYESSFEGAFEYYGGVSELEVPPDWVPLWVEGTEPGQNHRPEYKPEHTVVRVGLQAAKITTRHASHDAVLCYSVGGVEVGKKVTLEAWAANFRDRCGHAMRVGIDPTGRINYPNDDIMWGDWWGQDNGDWEPETYKRFVAEAIAESNYVAIYFHSKSRFPANNVASFWDDVRVQVEENGSTECRALTYAETVAAVKDGVLAAISDICGRL